MSRPTRSTPPRPVPAARAAALVGGALAGLALAPAALRAQAPDATPASASAATAPDARWRAFVGCWAAVADGAPSGAPILCVAPQGAQAVELVSIADGKIVARERLVAGGSRVPVTTTGGDDDCTGWQSGDWSADGTRLYLRSELACGRGVGQGRTGSGVLSMNGAGELLDVRGLTMTGVTGGSVRTGRFRPTAVPGGLFAADVQELLAAAPHRWRDERMLAGATLVGDDDVVEASRRVDAPIVQAWLGARRQGFALDARRLATLAKAGVAPATLDVMVALSYPRTFAVNPTTGELARLAPEPGERQVADAGARRGLGANNGGWGGGWGWGGPWGWNAGLDPWGFGFSPFAFNRGWGNGWGNGFGWSPWAQPVVIVNRPGYAAQQRNGQARRGEGYGFGDGSGSTGRPRASGSPSGSGSSGGASRGGYGGGSSGGSSGGGGRTAKPRGG